MNLNHLSTSSSAPKNKSGSLLNMTAVQLTLDEENERRRESAYHANRNRHAFGDITTLTKRQSHCTVHI